MLKPALLLKRWSEDLLDNSTVAPASNILTPGFWRRSDKGPFNTVDFDLEWYGCECNRAIFVFWFDAGTHLFLMSFERVFRSCLLLSLSCWLPEKARG